MQRTQTGRTCTEKVSKGDNVNIPEPVQGVFDDLIAKFAVKNKEYKGGASDPFRNFNQGAQLSGKTPEESLLGYMEKQIVNLYDAPKHNPERMSDVAFIDEKAGDIAVYCVLLMAMVRSKSIQSPKFTGMGKIILPQGIGSTQEWIKECQDSILSSRSKRETE